MLRAIQIVCLLFASALPLCGCQTTKDNGWRQFYSAWGGGELAITPRDNVEIRVVTMQQFRDAENAEIKYMDERKRAFEDATAEDGRALRKISLDAFRIKAEPDSIARLGLSAFNSTAPARRDDPALISFAKSIGADFVVITSEYAGETQGYTLAPGVAFTSANASASAWGSGGWGRATASGTSTTTTFTPVPATFQRWDNFAMYFRRITPEERALIDANRPK